MTALPVLRSPIPSGGRPLTQAESRDIRKQAKIRCSERCLVLPDINFLTLRLHHNRGIMYRKLPNGTIEPTEIILAAK